MIEQLQADRTSDKVNPEVMFRHLCRKFRRSVQKIGISKRKLTSNFGDSIAVVKLKRKIDVQIDAQIDVQSKLTLNR